MKHKFLDWLSSNHFSENAIHLLQSSFTCYRAETYSAALLMGYLGMLVIFKDRVMEAGKPALIKQGQWDKIIRELNYEDKWEQVIFDAVRLQGNDGKNGLKRDPIFAINDNLRDQIKYWKDRRNDCAHNKDNAITSAHVESFYSFLESNLPKITVEGGKATLLNKISKHYDTTQTQAGADVSPLVREIKNAVSKTEIDGFWKEAFARIDDLFDYSKEVTFCREVVKLQDSVIVSSLIKHLIGDGDKVLKQYIETEPSILCQLNYSAQKIRKFWMTDINHFRNPTAIYASMLRNNLIPQGEIAEANEKFALFISLPNNRQDNQDLILNDFGTALHELLFVRHSTQNDYKHWEFMNDHKTTYTRYLEFYPIDDAAIKILHLEFEKDDWRAFKLADSLNEMFSNNSQKRLEFRQRFTSMGLSYPKYLHALHDHTASV